MTRRSRRELERALAKLAGSDGTVREWTEHYLERIVGSDGYGVEFDVVGSDMVHVLETDGADIYAEPADVPDWINVDTDLPVRP